MLERSQVKDIKYLSTTDIPKSLRKDLKGEWERNGKSKAPPHRSYFDQERIVCTCDYPHLTVINMGDRKLHESSPAQNLALCPHTKQSLGSVVITNNRNLKWEH